MPLNNTNPSNNTKDSNNKESGGKKRKRFKPPTTEEVENYFNEGGLNLHTSKRLASRFINFYTSKNWYVGKNKMSKWRSTAANWLADEISKNQGNKVGNGNTREKAY
jgi:hypothetical protein